MAQQSSPDVDQILSTIRQVESSNNYGAQAKGSSASGAYQFIDSTWQASTKKSGLGTEYSRAKDAPPEVQDAVAAFAVRDILNRTGNDVTKVPLVWYTGNPEGRMTEDALKANQGLTPDKYQQKWLSVLSGGAPAQTAQAPRTTAQGPKQVGARVAAAFNPRDLPSSYTSALALNYLADTDPEGLTMSKVNEMLTEMIEDGGGAAKPAGGKILQQFAQAKSVDPFQFVLQEEKPKQRAVPRMPKMFADGGEVGEQYESLEDVMAAAPTQDAEQRQWEQEIPVRELTRQLNETVDRYRAGRASEADVKQFFPNYSDYDIANMFGMTDAGQSGPRPEITAQPFLTPEVYDRAMNRGRMEEYNVEREIREKSPNIYPNKRDFTLQLQQLADGGEVNYDQMAEQMTVGTLPTDQRPAGEVFRGIGQDIVRGAQYLPYDLAGAPVDIATMAMRPFGYNVEKPVGGSEYLIEKAQQAGIAQAPTGSTAETATRIGMGFVNPAAVARQIPRGIAALEKGAETMGTGAVRAITGKPEITTEQIYQAMADPQGIMKLAAPAATRPGGSFMYGDEVSQDLLELARTQKGPSEQAVIAFAPKIAKYMESQFSTPNDPLFAATLEGRFTPKTFYRPNSLFRGEAKQIEQITGIPLGEKDTLTIEHVNELLKRSKEGNEKAAKLVARGVDRSIYSTGQLTQDQIIDQLKNADVFNEAAKKIKDYVDMGIAKEFGSKENVAPIMAAFIRQKGVPTDDEQKAAFRTIEGRVTRKSEVEAERAIKSQAKNPLEAEYPIVVNPLQDYETSEFGRNLTPAMMEEMRRGKPIYKYSGPYGKPFDVNDVFEYMSENDPAKWSKMSAPELIIAASGKDPSTITNPTRIARMADDGLPLTPDQARVGTKSFMPVESPSLGKGSEWREITSKFGLRIEGGIMEHCLKRDSLGYCNRLMNQESRYFTLRDADGQPYVSIEVSKPIGMEDQDVPFNVIRQIKGHRNDPAVPLYGEEITDFLNRWQKEVGGKLSVSEKQEYVPSNFKPQQFGMTDPEGFAKGGMVDKPLYDRAV
jgi:hypothetical protein